VIALRRCLPSALAALAVLPWFSALPAPAQDASATAVLAPAAPEGDDPFPTPPAIAGNVAFWIRVFSEWSVGQVAIHDSTCPAVVYEVVDLPGEIEEGYSDAQRAFVERQRGRWAGYLQTLRAKVLAGDALDEMDRQWARYVSEPCGSLEGADLRVRSQRGLRERFRAGLERSGRYDKRFREIFREAGLPEDLACLPHIESSFQQHARSSAGAVGMWQFTRPAAKRYMTLSSAVDERLDPIAAARGAAAYLRDAHDKLGAWPLTVTSYNHGVEGMTAARERFGTDFDRIYREYDGKYFGFASKNFYAEFLAAREIARHPERYFPEGHAPEPEHDLDQVVLDRRMSVSSVARKYGVSVSDLLAINPAWSPRAVKAGTTALPEGLRVWLPRGTLERLAGGGKPGAAGVAAGAEPDATGPAHVVRRGESLNEIALRHGVTVDAIRQANGMTPRDALIHAGQRLLLPAPARRTAAAEPGPLRRHVVRAGDTLARIAEFHGVRLTDLLRANTISAASIIRPGQILHIPD